MYFRIYTFHQTRRTFTDEETQANNEQKWTTSEPRLIKDGYKTKTGCILQNVNMERNDENISV